jgi:hypothetical protein
LDGTLESVPITQAPATRKLRPLWSLLPFVRPYGRQIALALLFLALSAGARLRCLRRCATSSTTG